MKISRVFLCLLLIASVSGCVAVASLISASSEMGLGPQDRANLLNKRLDEFGRALYWGEAGEALSYAHASVRPELKRQILERRGSERVVDTEIGLVDFRQGNEEAIVTFVTKYYRVPYYVVKERSENQIWKFEGAGSGWLYYGVE